MISSINNINSINSQYDIKKDDKKDAYFKETLEKAMDEKDKNELKTACQEFESYFINNLFKEMRQTVNKSSLIPESNGEKIFREMLDEEYSKDISKAGGIGISDMLYKDLSKNIDNIYKIK